ERGGDLVLDADVVIVGTGAGGAVAARVLAERGLSVVSLEEGAHISAQEHGAMRPTESLRHVWRDGGLTFTVPVGDSPVINVTMGKVVGGSSMVTGGVCLRPPPEVTHRWRAERGLAMLTDQAIEAH
ncbi:MAG TPA: GMC family oxidoreductase N-terminal domain-containing protein, partial [Myxococcota bacterium]|nr:GMC family oxidoreductase N-terminal domain-containing protein [Myxococcota bacterium]